MELPSIFLEQIELNTRPKIEEHTLIVMDKSTHEEHRSQPLQMNKKQFLVAVTFLTGYNGMFNVSNSNKKFYFTKSINDDDFSVISIPPDVYELESFNDEKKRLFIKDGYFTEEKSPFINKPNFSTLGSILEIQPNIIGTQITFNRDDSFTDLLGFDSVEIYEKYNLSQKLVVILSFDNIFPEGNIAHGMIFKGKRSGIFHNFTMDVDPGYKYIEKFRGGVQWYIMESKDNIPSIFFKLKNGNGTLVSFNGQSLTFSLSIKETYFLKCLKR